MRVYLRSLTGQSTSLDLEPTDPISKLKNEVLRREGIPLEQQRLVITADKQWPQVLGMTAPISKDDEGIEQEDGSESDMTTEEAEALARRYFDHKDPGLYDNLTLEDYGIQEHACIHMMLWLRQRAWYPNEHKKSITFILEGESVQVEAPYSYSISDLKRLVEETYGIDDVSSRTTKLHDTGAVVKEGQTLHEISTSVGRDKFSACFDLVVPQDSHIPETNVSSNSSQCINELTHEAHEINVTWCLTYPSPVLKFTIDSVTCWSTFQDVKEEIEKKLGVKPGYQVLSLEGKPHIKDDEMLCDYYKSSRNIHLEIAHGRELHFFVETPDEPPRKLRMHLDLVYQVKLFKVRILKKLRLESATEFSLFVGDMQLDEERSVSFYNLKPWCTFRLATEGWSWYLV